MRCPKCHYLSFDPEPRCRNCGYGFSLDDTDLPLRAPESANESLRDLSLRHGHDDRAAVAPDTRDEELPPPRSRERQRHVPDATHDAVVPAQTFDDTVRAAARPAPTTELPLFVKALSASEPSLPPEPTPIVDDSLMRTSVEPRPPLAVRRKAPDSGAGAKARASAPAARKLGPLDRDLLEDLQRIENVARKEAAAEAKAETRAARERALPADRAGASKRLAAAGLDAALMGGLASVVFGIVLRWCDLRLAQAGVLPLVPIIAFLLIVGLGYLLMFTAAGGQTLGKMAFGIRIVDDAAADGRSISVKQAVYRAVLTVPSVLMLGAGFVPALVGDERAVHDRLAHTRVVRA